MISISQTHVFLKDCIHIHQMGSHFSPTEQEDKTPFCKLLALGGPRLLVEETK